MVVVFEAEAERDLEASVRYLREPLHRGSPELALRFVRAVASALERLAHQPHLGREYRADSPLLSGMRAIRVRGFADHLLFYRVDGDLLRIERVLHGARDLWALLDRQDEEG